MLLPQPLADALSAAVDDQTHLRLRPAVRATQAWIEKQNLGYSDLSGEFGEFFVRFASMPRRRDCNPEDLPGALEGHVPEERLLALAEGIAIATEE